MESGPLRVVCEALATAAKMVHPGQPRVAVLTKPADSVALRTRVDVYGVGRVLEEVHGVRPIYVSMADMARAQLDADGDLRLDGMALSVVYMCIRARAYMCIRAYAVHMCTMHVCTW